MVAGSPSPFARGINTILSFRLSYPLWGPRGGSGEISRGNGRESRAGGESLVSRVRMPVSFPGSWFQILDEILGGMINKR